MIRLEHLQRQLSSIIHGMAELCSSRNAHKHWLKSMSLRSPATTAGGVAGGRVKTSWADQYQVARRWMISAIASSARPAERRAAWGTTFRSVALVGLASLATGCAADGARWANSNREDVIVENIPYRVVWLRQTDGIDAHGSRNEFGVTLLPDPLLEKRRSMEAMRIVATRECRGAASSLNETSVDLSFAAQWRCAPNR